MPMRSALATIVVALAACSPAANTSADAGADVSQLVGTWVGTNTISNGGQPRTVVASLDVKAAPLGLVTVNICPDQSSVNATVTSPTAFTVVVPVTCPAVAVNGCASAALTYTSGSGVLGGGAPDGGVSDAGAPGTLNFTAAGTLAGCQSTPSPVMISFTGTKQ